MTRHTDFCKNCDWNYQNHPPDPTRGSTRPVRNSERIEFTQSYGVSDRLFLSAEAAFDHMRTHVMDQKSSAGRHIKSWAIYVKTV